MDIASKLIALVEYAKEQYETSAGEINPADMEKVEDFDFLIHFIKGE